jgi:hypothetical protein
MSENSTNLSQLGEFGLFDHMTKNLVALKLDNLRTERAVIILTHSNDL